MKNNKVVLIIMDGWGLAENPEVSAITHAKTPFFDQAMENWPHIQLDASGLPVGLPEGQMGNSEVGHMNIGAGRVVYQDLVRINLEVESGAFGNNEEVRSLVDYCTSNQKPVHLLGLLSDGGVHSSIDHLKGMVRILAEQGLKEIYIHCFMDGRDTSPNGGVSYLKELEESLAETGTGKVASLIGRYYAMDRDKRWERVKLAYDLLVHGKGAHFTSTDAAIQDAYDAGETDEFVKPRVIVENGEPIAQIQADDAILFFNFRTDRGRELTHVLSQANMPDERMETLPLYYATLTRYDHSFEGIHVLYEKDDIQNGLGDYLSGIGKQQIRIAETEKYPHVTFFFNGGREKEAAGETYIVCPSPKVATYDLKPEMSAYDIRDAIVAELNKGEVDFVCLNFANPDMVGHTGVFEAAVKACEVVDSCTQAVVEAADQQGYICLITADHGNADKMKNPDGSAHTAHTTVRVPFILRDPNADFVFKAKSGKLGDIAPTILDMMGVGIPEEMTGEVLIEHS